MFATYQRSGFVCGPAIPATGAIVRIATLCIIVLAFTIGCVSNQNPVASRNAHLDPNVPDILGGLWVLQIENLQHDVISTMAVEFSEDRADSCLGGNWKRIVVESHSTLDEQFFPVAGPLSYELDKNKLVIGRNEICDAYLHLSGELKDSKASGEYVAFGLGGGERLGYFSLTRSTR